MAGKRARCPNGHLVLVPALGVAPPPRWPDVGQRSTPAGYAAPAQGFVPGAAADRQQPAANPLPRPPSAYPTPHPTTFRKLYVGIVTTSVTWVLCVLAGYVFLFLLTQQRAQQRSRFNDERVRYFEEQMWRAERGEPTNWEFRPTTTRPATENLTIFQVLSAALLAIGVIIMIVQVVLFAVFLYKAWAVIQDGKARTTPGKAVGFLFIPFFNFYWAFVALRGLAQDLNNHAADLGLGARTASVGLATAYCILASCSILPVVGICLLVPTLIVAYLMLNSMKNAAADIASAKLGQV
jgi:hypothetical protein